MRRRAAPTVRFAPGFVTLEDRATPATFTVTTTQDNGNDAAPTAGSLRAAILGANAAAGADTINFAIVGAGVQTIAPPAPLPAVTDAVTIDGTTQQGFSGVPVVQLSGGGAGAGANGLDLRNHSGSVVRGLTVNGFAGAGVRIEAGGGHRLSGNFLGTNATGTAAAGNGVGVLVTGPSFGNQIGTSTTADRNVISGNKADGVLLTAGAVSNTVAGNFVGTDLNGGAPVGNGGAGVAITNGAAGNTVGGLAAGTGNVIGGNSGAGVRIADPVTAGNTVVGNRIGLGFSGAALGNGGDGVLATDAAGTAPAGGVTPATNNAVRNNTLASNGGNGVAVRGSSRFVRIEGNAVSANGGLGILVDPTANGGLAAPVITGTTFAFGGQSVNGTVAGQPGTQYRVEVFASSTADPSGFGEGQQSLGSVTVTTDAAGAGTFAFTTATTVTNKQITAVVTDVNGGDTSAFSRAVAAAGPLDAIGYAVGAGAGGAPVVAAVRANGSALYSLSVFDAAFTGGVRVAAADFNRDGVLDLVAGTGPGAATRVRVIDGKTKTEIQSIAPFEAAFTGGVYVSAGDLTGDGVPDLVISPDEGGGPRVRVFTGSGFAPVADFLGIEDNNFRGGVRTTVGDLNGDGRADLVVAAGFGGGPRVAGFGGKSVAAGAPTRIFNDQFVFEETLRNGAFVAAADVDADNRADLIVGGGPGGGPRVTVLCGTCLTASNNLKPLGNFFAGADAERGGVRVAARDLDGDGKADIVTGTGPGTQARLNVYLGTTVLNTSAAPTPIVSNTPFDQFAGGIFVG